MEPDELLHHDPLELDKKARALRSLIDRIARWVESADGAVPMDPPDVLPPKRSVGPADHGNIPVDKRLIDALPRPRVTRADDIIGNLSHYTSVGGAQALDRGIRRGLAGEQANATRDFIEGGLALGGFKGGRLPRPTVQLGASSALAHVAEAELASSAVAPLEKDFLRSAARGPVDHLPPSNAAQAVRRIVDAIEKSNRAASMAPELPRRGNRKFDNDPPPNTTPRPAMSWPTAPDHAERIAAAHADSPFWHTEHMPGAAGDSVVARGARTTFNEVEPERFHDALTSFAAARPSEAGYITWRTPQQMAEERMRTFLSPDGKTGYAIHPQSGDIRNVFNHGAPGAGSHALAEALTPARGGKILDAFDTGLGDFYRDFGFTETNRYPWNNEYRPTNWDEAKHGTPDVVEMVHPRAGQASADEHLASYAQARAARKGARPPLIHAAPPAPAPAAPTMSPFPDQRDLPRYVGKKKTLATLDDIRDESRRAYASPRFVDWVQRGQYGDWYLNPRTQQSAIDALGDDEGPLSFDRLMELVAATTARSAPPNNLRRGSLYRGYEMSGMLDPFELRAKRYKTVPKGMGHIANNAHHKLLADLIENGFLDSRGNPKPASFHQNLVGNFRPFTNDTRMTTGAAMVNPRLVELGAIDRKVSKKGAVTYSPRKWAYGTMEEAAQEVAAEHAARGYVGDIPYGADPTAFWQAKGWDGLAGEIPGASPSEGTFDDLFGRKRSENARRWNVSEREANNLIWAGNPLDLRLRSDIIPRGLFDGRRRSR